MAFKLSVLHQLLGPWAVLVSPRVKTDHGCASVHSPRGGVEPVPLPWKLGRLQWPAELTEQNVVEDASGTFETRSQEAL